MDEKRKNNVNRTRLLRIIDGKKFDDVVKYNIDYSTDIHGENPTIWFGHEFTDDNYFQFVDNPSKPMIRGQYMFEPYGHLSPYTIRLYQMRQENDRVTDAELIQAYKQFRQEHKYDGWGITIETFRESNEYNMFRTDHDELIRKFQLQDRELIRQLWGVDLPLDLQTAYNDDMSINHGMSSDWFEQELLRIGGHRRKN